MSSGFAASIARRTGAEMAAEPDTVSLAGMLDVMGAELHELARAADRVQDIVSGILGDMPTADAVAGTDIQAVDRLTQYLFALSTFTTNLGRVVPASWRADGARATAGLKLAELATRLSLGCPPISRPDPGDLDLF